METHNEQSESKRKLGETIAPVAASFDECPQANLNPNTKYYNRFHATG